MKFYEITEALEVSPGEYILHEPTQQVVLCGSFNRNADSIRVMAQGKMFTDQIKNFKKIRIGQKERKEIRNQSRCKGCRK